MPSRRVSRVIGEVGATLHNIETETGAKFDIEEDPDQPAVGIYADTEVILNKAMQRTIDIVGSSRCKLDDDGWNVLHS